MHQASPLLSFTKASQANQAEIRVRCDQPSPYRVNRYITGKFCEHLGWNINNGMLAQIVRNCTFADYPYTTGQATPDGNNQVIIDNEEIAKRIRREGVRFGWPDNTIEDLLLARCDGLACWWTRVGACEVVRVSPDVGRYGGRAQRVEVSEAGAGIAQWIYLPLHRVRDYTYEIVVRAPKNMQLTLALHSAQTSSIVAEAPLGQIGSNWQNFCGSLSVPADCPEDGQYRLALLAEAPSHFVVERVLLWPADHVNGADPDVLRALKDSKLPLLRWPGGNFVSGYHWEDGIGPADRRPTCANPAWEGVEPNLFGTDEFILFCRNVGCEPMICVNAGNGTPEEAARWIEYCNGSVDTPMGARRAENGFPEPHQVRFWEIGNELWGDWQVSWTTPAGYVDRYRRFQQAMLQADPRIQVVACGAPVLWDKEWNDTICKELGPSLQQTTDHAVIIGRVTWDSDPLDLYRDAMAIPIVLDRRWRELRQKMIAAGISHPELAVTELQLCPRIIAPENLGKPQRLSWNNLACYNTLVEALYDVLLYHVAVRMAPFMGIITHSATVNHGGGITKERERVYAHPCHYAQTLFADFRETTPLAVEISVATEKAPIVLGTLKNANEREIEYGVIDALATRADDGTLLISVVHCGTTGPVELAIDLGEFASAAWATVYILTADLPWACNTLQDPEHIIPVTSQLKIEDQRLTLSISPFSFMTIRIPPRQMNDA